MSKLKVKYQDSQVIVTAKLDKNEEINQKEIEIFNSKFIRGLMRPKVLGNKKIEYLAPGNVSLSAHLKMGLTKNDFFLVFAQFVECLKKLEWNGFNINNLLLKTDYIFYNQITKEVQFIYQPIFNSQNENNIFTFIYDLVGKLVPSISEDNSYLNHIVSTVRNMQTISTEILEGYIVKVYPQIYKQVRRAKPGESQSLKPTGRTYFEKKYDETGGKIIEKNDDPISELIDSSSDNGSFGGYSYDNGSTGGYSTIDPYESGGYTPETDILINDGFGEGTTVLGDNEGTALLMKNGPSFPYIIRLNTYEQVMINKPVFRIGKEKSYVDYFVMNNNAVSRIHADIITKNGQYFIKDNNSTNHTFVNGTMIPVNQTVEIFDGDSLMLANEPFEFHID